MFVVKRKYKKNQRMNLVSFVETKTLNRLVIINHIYFKPIESKLQIMTN